MTVQGPEGNWPRLDCRVKQWCFVKDIYYAFVLESKASEGQEFLCNWEKQRERQGKGNGMFYQNKLSVKMQHFLITLKSCWECRCCLEGAFPVSLSTTVRPWGSQGGGEPGVPGWCWGPEQSLPEGLRRMPGLRPDSPLPLAHRQFEASGHLCPSRLWTLSLNTWLQCDSPPNRATPPREPGVSSLAPSSCQRLPQTSTVPGPSQTWAGLLGAGQRAPPPT